MRGERLTIRRIPMNKTYIISVDQMCSIDADSEAKALADAKGAFIKMLEKGEANLIVMEVDTDER
jgi:hypothetical protein|tara:strand:- start:847 stop:1041 length:195 start_codon:yes stop_codon:yes gene_type:complete